MTVYTFSATVRVRSSSGAIMILKTQVIAEDSYRAKLLLEAQYGVGNVMTLPIRS